MRAMLLRLLAGALALGIAAQAAPQSRVVNPHTFGSGITVESTGKANGEQFYAKSGETVFAHSNDVTEAQATGTGTDFNPSSVYFAIKFTTSASVSFVQGISLRIKKTGALAATDHLDFALYSDSAGAPGALISSGGQIFGGAVGTTYAELYTLLQNVNSALSPSTTYWVVITRGETGGGEFIIDGALGAGSLYEGAGLGTLADTGKVAYFKIYARSQYPIHSVGKFTHGVWGVSVTGVGVRGDSTGHYGGFFQSTYDPGARGVSTYEEGLLGSSTYGNGVTGSTPSTAAYGVYGENTAGSGGFPGVYGNSASGPGVLANTAMGGVRPFGIRSFQGIVFGPQSRLLYEASSPPSSGTYTTGDVLFNNAMSARGGAAFWYAVQGGTPGTWGAVNIEGASADRGDANVTLTAGADASTQFFSTALTANRTITLSTTGAYNGAKFRIVRSGLGNFTLTVGAVKVLPANTAAWCDVMYDGGAWRLTAYGTL